MEDRESNRAKVVNVKKSKKSHLGRNVLIGLALAAILATGIIRVTQDGNNVITNRYKTKNYDQFTEESSTLTYNDIFADSYRIDKTTVYYNPDSTDFFQAMGKTFYLKYYDKYYGGTDGSILFKNYNGAGLVTWLNDDGTYNLVDADDTTAVIISDIVSIDGYFYFQNYDSKNGGVDKSKFSLANGMVLIYTDSKGTKHMVDANNMTLEIASGFTSYINDGDYVVFFYPDGTTSRIHNGDIIAAHDTLVRAKK